MGRRSLYVQCDISKSSDVEHLFEKTLETFGKVDILVNNAGGSHGGCAVVDLPEESWIRTYDVNMKGTFLCSKAAAADMIKHKTGKIVNISSAVGKIGTGRSSAYSSAKAAVNAFTHALARELAVYNVNVNCICPGAILSESRKTRGDEKVDRGGWFGRPMIPPFGWGTPEDIANVVAFLVSNESKYISGQSINVDGCIW